MNSRRPQLLLVLPALILFGILVAGCTPVNDGESQSSASSSSLELFVYYSNSNLNASMDDCSSVYPVARDLSGSTDIVFSLARALFAGPTDAEKSAGVSSFFSLDTANAVRSVTLKGNTAYVNLMDIRSIIPNASSSCGSSIFFAEIHRTLTQLPGIDRVILAIDGDTEPLYEWLQIGCAAENDFCDNEAFGDDGQSSVLY